MREKTNPEAENSSGTKAEKFERLAEKRVNEALKKLRLVSNLANRKNYSYSDEHAKQIIEALEAEFRLLKMKFKGGFENEETRFTFRDK